MGFPTTIICVVAFVFVSNAFRPSRIWKFCSKDLCLCSHSVASCIRHGDNLTFIPPLPGYITELNFSFNHLHSVSQLTFVNISRLKIENLALVSNNIVIISSNSFDRFEKLAVLDLSFNPVGLVSLKGVLQSLWTLPVYFLSLNGMGIGDQLFEAVQFLNSTKLTLMSVYKNNLTLYNQTSFDHVPMLITIHLDYNYISQVIIEQSPHLKTISLEYNSLSTVPDFCTNKRNPHMKNLILAHNRIAEFKGANIECLQHLRLLTLNANPISVIRKNSFAMLRSLHILILHDLRGPLNYIEEFAFNNSEVVWINLKSNRIKFETVSPRMFWGCVNLKSLSLSYNRFSNVNDTMMEELFHPINQLTSLDMGSCGLRAIPKVLTKNLTKLKWLTLFKNYIKSWPPGTFDSMTSLTELYLMGNKIGNIKEDSFPVDIRQRLKQINLAQNPFGCTCDLLWFLNWFKTNRTIFKEYDHSYKCSSPLSLQDVQLIHVHLSEQKCLIGVMTTFVIVAAASFGVLFTIIISVFYRKRWSLKHYWYMRGHRQRRQQEIDLDYMYDIYVIYSEEDLRWITQEMLPFLEDTKGLKLCIQQRDFTLGKAMVDCIVEAVHCSRGFILVASNTFVEEEWCQFQLQLAHKHNEERDLDLLVVILLEEVDQRHITPALYAVIKTKDYISWPVDDEDRITFWEDVYQEITQ
ncbi:toll-like receptor 3 [Gigantopelta aegis]|uniref:toll-like receptor 3 n=1 Tax=Gigantopelta aegis TaxID=1735272 RepID=UPI001B88BE48|nr:toll-like receptor 3 [Gigantopelta aegis]